jgi:hypothetical protein
MHTCIHLSNYILTLANAIEVTNDSDIVKEQTREFDRCFARFIRLIEETEHITEVQPSKAYNKFIRLKLVDLCKTMPNLSAMNYLEIAMNAYSEMPKN